MKDKIYLTQQAKEEIEAKIAELKSEIFDETYEEGIINNAENRGKISVLKKILASATILPVEESWSIVGSKSTGSEFSVPSATQEKYPQGILIQPKKSDEKDNL